MEPTITHQPQNPILDAAIASYLQAVERGEQPDRQQFLAQHAQLADELTRFFHDQDEINRLTQPASTRLGPGSLLGSYRIVREIGRGGMGIVYEAIHEALKKRVALKLLPLSPTTSGSHLERFLREAQTAAALHHTNIVPVFDVGQVDGLPFYAMQFIEGKTLDKLFPSRQVEGTDVLSPSPSWGEGLGVRGSESSVLAPDSKRVQHKNKPLTPGPSPREGEGRKNHYKHIAQLGRQAALGLTYAHERGVIHRDIKPSNLILDQQGVLWITDFGLAKRLADVTLTAAGQLLGTPRYMSPEQASAAKNPVDHRTDIYSLGVTLYELLVGRPAHDGQTPPEVVNQILTRDPVSPRRIDPQLPRDLETVVMKAMAKMPGDRYASAAELAEDLGRFTQGEPVQARRVGVLGRTWRWAKREPTVAGLVGAVFVVTLASSVILYLSREDAKQQRDIASIRQHHTRTLLTQVSLKPPELYDKFDLPTLWMIEPLLDDSVTGVTKSTLMKRCEYSLQMIGDTRLGRSTLLHISGLLNEDIGGLWFDKETEHILIEERRPDAQRKYDPLVGGPTPHINFAKLPCKVDAYNIRTGEFTESRIMKEGTDFKKSVEGMTIEFVNAKLLVKANRFTYESVSVKGHDMLQSFGNLFNLYLRLRYDGISYSPPIRLIDTDIRFLHEMSQDHKWLAMVFHAPEHTLDDSEGYEVWMDDSTVVVIFLPQQARMSLDYIIELTQLLACHRLDRGRYVPLTLDETRAGWTTLQAKYPDVFTIPIEECLAWHLKEDADSVRKKHQHAALFAANFDCRDRPNEPHPFVARGRLFTVLGDYDKAAADFATAWKLGGTGWVKSECRRIVRDAWRVLQTAPSPVVAAPSPLTPLPRRGEGNQTAEVDTNQTADLRAAYRKLQIASTYLEQDPRTLAIALLGKPPLHRMALTVAKQRLGIEWDERDQAAMTSLLR